MSLLAVTILCSAALADVATEPESCPPGAVGVTAHSPYCTPGTCDDGCADGETCQPLGLCVIDEERPCGGMTTPGSECTYQHVEALSACETQDDCQQGTCIVADRCAAEPAGCGCTSGVSVATGVVLVGLLPWLRRRRAAGEQPVNRGP